MRGEGGRASGPGAEPRPYLGLPRGHGQAAPRPPSDWNWRQGYKSLWEGRTPVGSGLTWAPHDAGPREEGGQKQQPQHLRRERARRDSSGPEGARGLCSCVSGDSAPTLPGSTDLCSGGPPRSFIFWPQEVGGRLGQCSICGVGGGWGRKAAGCQAEAGGGCHLDTPSPAHAPPETRPPSATRTGPRQCLQQRKIPARPKAGSYTPGGREAPLLTPSSEHGSPGLRHVATQRADLLPQGGRTPRAKDASAPATVPTSGASRRREAFAPLRTPPSISRVCSGGWGAGSPSHTWEARLPPWPPTSG